MTSNRAVFQQFAVAPSSSHAEYHQRAIQVHGRSKFEGRTAHQDDYQAWELPTDVVPAKQERALPALPFTATSTYSDVFMEHPLEPHPKRVSLAFKGNGAKFDATSSYAQDFVPKDIPLQEALAPQSKPFSSAKFDGTTSYGEEYPVRALDPEHYRGKAQGQQLHKPRRVPFDATTAYKEHFVQHPMDVIPKHSPTRRPPQALKFEGSTTHKDAFKNWELPPRRDTLGVATVGDRLYVLIPSQLPAPATTKQTFTTVRDDQTEMCLMIYEGSFPVASKNRLLGQFQLVNITPAPVGVPRVQVTFHLDAQNSLKVEAVDLNSGRQHLWLRNKGVIRVQPAELKESQAVAACA